MKKLLSLKDLRIILKTEYGPVHAVRGVSFDLFEGESLAIVGESGCGKSVTCKSILRLIPDHVTQTRGGEIEFDGKNLLQLSERKMQKIRGKRIGMVFQDPMTSLNPTMPVGKQIIESYVKHFPNVSKTMAYNKGIDLLKMVKIPDPALRFHQYPHELSGGIRQRVMIAIALAPEPDILIADEPTTALDVTIQAQILELLRELQAKFNMSIILVTHDLSIVAGFCDRILVMYGGEIIEEASTIALFDAPSHPYTQSLLRSLPRLDQSKCQDLMPIEGSPPNLMFPPTGCCFADRCQLAKPECSVNSPPRIELAGNRAAKCWLYNNNEKNDENATTPDQTSEQVLQGKRERVKSC